MNPFKLFYQSGRRDIAREILKEYATKDALAGYVADGVNNLILSRLSRFDERDVAAVTERCCKVALLAAEVGEAVKDKQITKDEIFAIIAKIEELVGAALTQENLDNLVNKIVEKIP